MLDPQRFASAPFLAAQSWAVPRALTTIRAALRAELDRLIAIGRKEARDAGVPFLTLLRNQIATRALDDLADARPLLVRVSEVGRGEEQTTCRALLAFLPPASAGARLSEQLLSSDAPPTAADFRASLTGPVLLQALLTQIDRDGQKRPGDTVERLLGLADATWDMPLPTPPDELAETARTLGASWRDARLPRLGQRALARLPIGVRRAILAHPGAREHILARAFLARLARDLDGHPDSPAAVANDRAAAAAIARRDFASMSVRRMVGHLSPAALGALVDGTLVGTPPDPGDPVPAPPGVLAALRAIPAPARRARALFAAVPPSRRAALIARLAPDERAALGAPRRAQADVPDLALGEDWGRALLHAPTAPAFGFVRAVLRDIGGYDQVLAWGVRQEEGLEGRRAALARDWLATLATDALAAAVGQEAGVCLRALRGRDVPRPLVDALAAMLGDPARFTDFNAAYGETGLRALLAADTALTVGALRSALDGARNARDRATRSAVLAAATAVAPDQLPAIVGGRLPIAEFAYLIEALPSPLRRRHRAWLFSLTARGRIPAWQAHLRALRRAGAPPGPALVASVAAAGPAALEAATRHYPAAFRDLALARLPLHALLRLAFRDPVFGLAVEQRVPRGRLRAAIPWVREAWANRPTYATAYEVALAFSLPDAAYLVALAQHAEPPAAPASAGRAFDDRYRTYALPKRAGGNRIITVPDAQLKRLQRRLLDHGFGEVRLHPAAHGFRSGRSILTNARPHVGRELVVNIDIESFFPSTGHAHIAAACRQLWGGRLSPRAALFVADLCSYDGALPTGAPTSPAIANIVLAAADRALATAARRRGIAYTRYADDLTFSGGGDAKRLLPFARKVLADYGYALDEGKLNLFRRGRRQVVAGLVVNDKPNLPRRLRRRLRAAIHRRGHGETPTWHGQPMSDPELRGRIAYLGLVQPEESARHRQRLASAPQSALPDGVASAGEEGST